MADEKRPEWMTSIASTVNSEDYLLGRKIDKTFELSQKEKAEKAREARIELIAKDKIKHSDDPLLDLERRRRELKMQIIQNPVLLKQFRDRLLKETRSGKEQSIDGAPDTYADRHEKSPPNASRHEVRDGSSRNRESKEHRHKHRDDDSRYQQSSEDRSRHRNAKSKDRESRHHGSKHDSSSRRSESSRHGSRHSDSWHKHRSSHISRSRSRSPGSRHKQRHRHHERRDRSRSPSYHGRS